MRSDRLALFVLVDCGVGGAILFQPVTTEPWSNPADPCHVRVMNVIPSDRETPLEAEQVDDGSDAGHTRALLRQVGRMRALLAELSLVEAHHRLTFGDDSTSGEGLVMVLLRGLSDEDGAVTRWDSEPENVNEERE